MVVNETARATKLFPTGCSHKSSYPHFEHEMTVSGGWKVQDVDAENI